MQFLVTLTARRSTEITMGKLSTAIRIWLLFAFDAMPESSVRDDEKPMAPRNNMTLNRPKSAIGFFNSTAKRINPLKERIEVSRKL
jgi:hypothetical protein